MITKALYEFENDCLNLEKYKDVSYLAVGDERLIDYLKNENVNISEIKSPQCFDVCWGLANTITVSYYDAKSLLATLLAMTIDKCNCLSIYDYILKFQDEFEVAEKLSEPDLMRLRSLAYSLNSSEIVVADNVIKSYKDVLVKIYRMLEEHQPEVNIRKFTSGEFIPDNLFYYYGKLVEICASYVKGKDFIVNPNGNYCSGMFPIKKGYNSNYELVIDDVKSVIRSLTESTFFSSVDALWESGNNSVIFSIACLEMINKLINILLQEEGVS